MIGTFDISHKGHIFYLLLEKSNYKFCSIDSFFFINETVIINFDLFQSVLFLAVIA